MAKRKTDVAGSWKIAGKELWDSVLDLLPGIDVADYKARLLALIFVRWATEAFDAYRAHLDAEMMSPRSENYQPNETFRRHLLEQREPYRAQGIPWIADQARWSRLVDAAVQDDISQRVDQAMAELGRDNPYLHGVLPGDFAELTKHHSRALGGLIRLLDVLSAENAPEPVESAGDPLVQAYDYFIPRFAEKEHDVKDVSPTPPTLAALMAKLLQPKNGRVYDPCFGSGGLLVAAAEFARGQGGAVEVIGQELRPQAWQVGQLNLLIRGIATDAGAKAVSTFTEDRHPGLQADTVLANPPFNQKDWNPGGLADDSRWRFGAPGKNDANFAWIQHAVSKLKPRGVACVIMPNGSLSSNGLSAKIRESLVASGVVECIVTLPGKLFYGGSAIPACLWIFRNGRDVSGNHGRVLFIDAAKGIIGTPVAGNRIELAADDQARIASAYQQWRDNAEGVYQDQPGFCCSTSLADIQASGWLLIPGRYVGHRDAAVDIETGRQEIKRLTQILRTLFSESDRLQSVILDQLESLEPGDPQRP